MAQYIQFGTTNSGNLLVEVTPDEVMVTPGVIKSGLKEKVQDAVVVAQASLEEALTRAVQSNATLFVQAVEGLQQQPNEMEITFGIKATGEVGNVAVAKVAGEGNYTVRLMWVRKQE